MTHYADFRTNDPQTIFSLIAKYPFALICKNGSNGETPDVINAPVIISENGKTLEFHFARANDTWKNIAGGGAVKIIFNGPNAHISPAWYKSRFANDDRSKTAPTWDYVQAVLEGEVRQMDDVSLVRHLQRLTTHFEGENGWRFSELAPDKMQVWKTLIGGFIFEIKSTEAIFKLSQEQASADQTHIVDALRARDEGGDKAVAELISQRPKNN